MLLVVGACSSGPYASPTPSTAEAPTVTEIAKAAPPDISDARVIDDAIVFHVSKPHVSEAVEYYQVRMDGGLWRALDASEWGFAQGEAGIKVTLRGLTLTPGQSRLVQLRAVSQSGFGVESRVARIDTDVTVEGPDLDDRGPVDIDSAMGLGGSTSTSTRTPSDPMRQTIVIVIELLAALGLVAIGVFMGRRLRRT